MKTTYDHFVVRNENTNEFWEFSPDNTLFDVVQFINQFTKNEALNMRIGVYLFEDPDTDVYITNGIVLHKDCSLWNG